MVQSLCCKFSSAAAWPRSAAKFGVRSTTADPTRRSACRSAVKVWAGTIYTLENATVQATEGLTRVTEMKDGSTKFEKLELEENQRIMFTSPEIANLNSAIAEHEETIRQMQTQLGFMQASFRQLEVEKEALEEELVIAKENAKDSEEEEEEEERPAWDTEDVDTPKVFKREELVIC